MIDSGHLLDLSDELASTRGRGAPRQVRLRRAISTAYYALFHHLVERATAEMLGANRGDGRYGLICRSAEHRTMKSVCLNIQSDTSAPLGIRSCAADFVGLQQLRHEADYNPAARFTLSEAQAAISRASGAIQAIDGAPADDRVMFLARLLFQNRRS